MMAGLRLGLRMSETALLVAALLAAGVIAATQDPPVAEAALRSAVASPDIPFTASGCNQDVCIHIEGTGTYVTDWWTTATLASATCTEARFWAGGVLVHTGYTHCGSSGTTYSSDWPDPGYFPAGTELCQTWDNVPGRPCEWIE